MATNILMPALSPTMTDGTLARWLVKEGDQVRAGDVIAEIETDKATMEVEAVDEGVLSRILVPDGTSGVKVNEPIALLQAEGETDAAPAPPVAEKAGELTPENAETPAEAPQAAAPTPASAPAPMANGHDAERVFASPLARRMAKQAGIELASLRGTGRGPGDVPDVRGAAAGLHSRHRAAQLERPVRELELMEQPADVALQQAEVALGLLEFGARGALRVARAGELGARLGDRLAVQVEQGHLLVSSGTADLGAFRS